jgi:HlyD family secretion protein
MKIALPLVAAAMFLNMLFGLLKNPKREIQEPQNPVTVSAFERAVSGLGVAEPQSEIINIGTNFSGVVEKVYVKAGDRIKKGEKLFTIDDREAKASLDLKTAQYKAAELDAKDKQQEFEMYRKLDDKRAYSRDEFNKKKIAAEISEQKARQAKAEMEMARVVFEKLTVRAPIDAEILKVDIRPGEFAQAGFAVGATKTLISLGDLSLMHVRVEIDESDAHLLSTKNPAVAFLRGQPTFKIPLKFVRIEPYVVPKISISGGNAEKIDTRVMQVIYAFENSFDPKILVGQQLDVYIESK